MKIISVKYISGYVIKIFFKNGIVKTIDLKTFLMTAINPMTTKYRDVKLFKSVRVENGYLAWGKNEMDLSAESLYTWKT